MPKPKVRFKRDDGRGYPEWKTIPMSEVFTEISEKNHPEMPVLSVQQGVGTVLRDSSDRNILYDKSNLKNYKAMKKDDYIIHLRSFEGGLECSNYDGISSPAYRILRSQAILPAAYRDYFRSYDFIHNKLAVSVVGIRDGKNIDMDTFWQIPMSVPSLEEQQKIADFLSSVDEVISTSEQEVANIEKQKKAVMKKIFSQEVRFKRMDGSDFPEWEKSTISEVSYVSGGKTPSMSNVSYWNNPSVNWISSKDMKSGRISKSEMQISENAAKTMKVYKPGTVLVVVRSGILRHSLPVAVLDEKSTINQDIKAFEVYGCDSDYFAYFLKAQESIVIRDYVKKGTTVQSVQVEDLIRMMIPIPCIEEQRLIADFLSDFDEAIAAAKKELELWKELKKGLLQQMFV